MNNIIVPISPVEQVQAMPGLKETYGHVNTRSVLDVFQAKGWDVASTAMLKPRAMHRAGYQRHLVRLENESFSSIPGLSEDNASKPQLCLLNSHDGTTAFRLFLGLLRYACLNGIISGLALRDFKAVHSRNVLTRLAEGIQYLSDNMQSLFNQVQALQGVQFTPAQVAEYTKAMFDARLSNVGRILSVNYTCPIIRAQDNASDGFTVLNRVQETLVRGGIHYVYARDTKTVSGQVLATQTVHSTTKRLASIQSQIKLNRLAYDTAAQIAGISIPKAA